MRMERFFEKDWLTRYRYYLSDPVKKGMNMELVEDEPVEFLKLWARLGKQFPSEYLEAPLYNTFRTLVSGQAIPAAIWNIR